MDLHRGHRLALAAIAFATLISGCSGRDPSELDMARAPIDPLVFDETLNADVYPQPFSGTDVDALGLDSTYATSGDYSLKIRIPGEGSALGGYAGGVLTAVGGRDFADFNALTLRARSSVPSTLNEVGFGNDNTGTSRYSAGRANTPLTREWSLVVIPIPSAGKLISERGLFTYAEGWEEGQPDGHEIWFDEIRFEKLDYITNPRPFMPTVDKEYFVGSTVNLETFTLFDVDGATVRVNHQSGYFDFDISDPGVARVDGDIIRVSGPGNAVITATMDTLDVAGSATLTAYAPPTAPAPTPTLPAGDVISMFSDAYPDVPIDSWNPHWTYSTAELADYAVDGDAAKMYTALNFVGIVFDSNPIDASAMTHLHLDVFAPVGTNFRVLAVTGGGSRELEFDATTAPAFAAGDWSSLDIPLDQFDLAGAWGIVRQLVLSTDDARLVLVDNVYWHR